MLKLNEKVLFLFISIQKPNLNDIFFPESFFGMFGFLDISKYEAIRGKLVDNGIIIYNELINQYVYTDFGSKIGQLRFKEIRTSGDKREIEFLNKLVKKGVFSHIERND